MSGTPPANRVRGALQDFLHDEAAGGIVLVIGAVAALVWANSPFSESYFDLWGQYLTLGWGPIALTETCSTGSTTA
jgi:NhaA family Na+:H+ antiporter